MGELANALTRRSGTIKSAPKAKAAANEEVTPPPPKVARERKMLENERCLKMRDV